MPSRHTDELTDQQWLLLAPLIPEPPRRPDGRGRPWRSCREVMNGVLWILRTGAPWRDMPARFPPHQTCHRRFQQWSRTGTLEQALCALAQHLKEYGGIDVSECFIDGTFAPAKRGQSVGKTKRGKGTKLMAVADRSGLPVAICIASASPHETRLVQSVHETRLVQSVLDRRFFAALPERLIGDKIYDSDPLDASLAEQGVALIAPHRKNRKRAATQDGRVLRRYRRRWKVERLFAWLQQFRRLVVRYEWHEANFLGFVHLACLKILLRQFQHL